MFPDSLSFSEPWNEDAGGFDISAVVLATGFEFAGFDEGDAGEFEEEEEEYGGNELGINLPVLTDRR